ncbi:MAG: 30S ribosomal protein S21 [Bacteroidia bacterium]|nr:30S ribosomal protein S21 [Bacteroidia bacterium]
MIYISIKDSENLDKALKKYKKKFEKIGVVKELRVRQAFEKKSVTRRMELRRAAYREQVQREHAG